MPSNEDSDHPIVDCPWEYEIVLFCYHVAAVDWEDSYIDMTLRRGSVVRRLRFFAPTDLQIGRGFPQPTGDLCILDVRGRQWENVGVLVGDNGPNEGLVSFLARDVVDLDAS